MKGLYLVSIFLAFAATSLAIECDVRQQHLVWKTDPVDCAKFYVCFGARSFHFTCPLRTVWSQEAVTCVYIGSHWDKCTNRKPEEPCSRPGVELEVKNDNCAQYYNCSSSSGRITFDPRVHECQYPLLFSAATRRCDSYISVDCGARKEIRDPCEYKVNHCSRSIHCIPCRVRHPTCIGRSDGLHAWEGREWSPFYAMCDKERVVDQGQCDSTKKVQIFNPKTRMCEDEINRWVG